MNRVLSGATTSGQNKPWSVRNKRILCIPQTSSITRASPSDCFVSYSGYSMEKYYPSAEMQSVYSTASADWATNSCVKIIYITYKYIIMELLMLNSNIFIIKGFRTIVFSLIVISTTFWSICPPAFFWCLPNSGTYTELRTRSFIESTGVTSSDSVSHMSSRTHWITVIGVGSISF